MLDPKAPVGIAITTYERDNPVLTHVFWGKTIEQAVGYAKSHLLTDYFFSSSWIGELPWGETILILSNEVQVLNHSETSAKIEERIYNYLQQQGETIHNQQDNLGQAHLIQVLKQSSA